MKIAEGERDVGVAHLSRQIVEELIGREDPQADGYDQAVLDIDGV